MVPTQRLGWCGQISERNFRGGFKFGCKTCYLPSTCVTTIESWRCHSTTFEDCEIDSSCLAFLAMSSFPPFCFPLFLSPGEFREFCLCCFNSCLSSSVNTSVNTSLTCQLVVHHPYYLCYVNPLSIPSPHPQHLSPCGSSVFVLRNRAEERILLEKTDLFSALVVRTPAGSSAWTPVTFPPPLLQPHPGRLPSACPPCAAPCVANGTILSGSTPTLFPTLVLCPSPPRCRAPWNVTGVICHLPECRRALLLHPTSKRICQIHPDTRQG